MNDAFGDALAEWAHENRHNWPPKSDVGGFDKRAFGKRVTEIRDACGLRQIDLAERAGISVTFISEVENGKRDISASTLTRMAWVLGNVSLDYLVLGRSRWPTRTMR